MAQQQKKSDIESRDAPDRDVADALGSRPSADSTRPAADPTASDHNSGGDARGLDRRRPTFMIAPRQAPGLQTFSVDFVAQQLKESPDIEMLGTIEPPRLLGLQSVDGTGMGSILRARMHYDKARQLQRQAGPRLLVERDAPLTFGLETPSSGHGNPGCLVPLGEDFETTIEVKNASGPLAGAEVYIFGSVWPTQGVTDDRGRVTLTIRGDTPDTIRAVYIKPRIDHWGLWLASPVIRPGGISSVRLNH
jgi:hypothetical protein